MISVDEVFYENLNTIIGLLQSCEQWLTYIACCLFVLMIVGTVFAFCGVVYKLLMRFA